MKGGMFQYLRIARIDHWVKNLFALPGIVLAFMLTGGMQNLSFENFLIGMLAVCLLLSANYSINEYLDMNFDKHHPTKKLDTLRILKEQEKLSVK